MSHAQNSNRVDKNELQENEWSGRRHDASLMDRDNPKHARAHEDRDDEEKEQQKRKKRLA